MMKFLLMFTFVTCAFAHRFFQDKIVGGFIANSGQFPYQVSLRYYKEHICGGSIINQNTILTAAHCIDDRSLSELFKTIHRLDITKLNIVAGTNELNRGGLWYSVSRCIKHENYNYEKCINDIAVIKVTTPIKFNMYIQPIAIDSSFTFHYAQCYVSGWGATKYNGSIPNNLLYVEGYVVDLHKCKQAYFGKRFPVLESNICTFSRYGVGTCSGDSGGPLVSNNKQIGIVSWSAACAVGLPDVFTRVSYYVDWITSQ